MKPTVVTWMKSCKFSFLTGIFSVVALLPLVAQRAQAADVQMTTNQNLCPFPSELDLVSSLRQNLGNDLFQICTETTCGIVNWAAEKGAEYPHCQEFFIKKNGRLGELGRLVADGVSQDMLEKKDKSVFLQSYPDIEEVCPGFKDMRPITKVAFWTYAFEILGFFESTCNPNEENHSANVPNPPAVGLYQLEQNPEIRGWRGPHCKVPAAVIKKPKENTACAIDVLKGLLTRNKSFFSKRNAKGRLGPNYWEALNEPRKGHRSPKNEKYRKYLPRFPGCLATAETE